MGCLMRDTFGVKPRAQAGDLPFLHVALDRAFLQVADRGRRGGGHGGRQRGGEDEPDAKLRMKSHSAWEPVM
jgi:hypothetical protein